MTQEVNVGAGGIVNNGVVTPEGRPGEAELLDTTIWVPSTLG